MRSSALRSLILGAFACVALALAAGRSAHAQPACPNPPVTSDPGVPCDVTICFGTDNCVTVKPGETQTPRGDASGPITVDTPNGPVTIPGGECVKNIQVARGVCVDVCFDWWKCVITITKSSGPCPAPIDRVPIERHLGGAGH